MTAETPTPRKFTRLPTHVAIVPDGNGRWAEKRGLPRLHGHQAGAENMYKMVRYLNEYPVKYVSLYGFSTENWARPETEVQGLFELLREFIGRYLPEIHERDISLRHSGRLHQLPENLQPVSTRAVELTKDHDRMILNVAFNYGGRAEIPPARLRPLSPSGTARPTTSSTVGMMSVLDTGWDSRAAGIDLW